MKISNGFWHRRVSSLPTPLTRHPRSSNGLQGTKPAAALWKLSHYFTRSNTPLAWVQSNGCVRIFARWQPNADVCVRGFSRGDTEPSRRVSLQAACPYIRNKKLPTIWVSYGQDNAEIPKHHVWRSNHFFNHFTGKVLFTFSPIIWTNHFSGRIFSRLRRAFNHSSLIILVGKIFRLRRANQPF